MAPTNPKKDLVVWQEEMYALAKASDPDDLIKPTCLPVQRYQEVVSPGATVQDGFNRMFANPERYRYNLYWTAMNVLPDLPKGIRDGIINAIAGLGGGTACNLWYRCPHITGAEADRLKAVFMDQMPSMRRKIEAGLQRKGGGRG